LQAIAQQDSVGQAGQRIVHRCAPLFLKGIGPE
jgi:hypothetical protein